MSGTLPDLARLYADALESYVSGRGEAALNEAYEIGRQALADGIGVLDIAAVHHAALAGGGAVTPERLGKGREFLAECLSPFEMSLLGYRESNTQLAMLNESLRQAHVEALRANQQLQTEMSERQRAEEALRQSQKLQAIGRLAGGVAHHFNNLLTVVLGNVDLARQHADLQGERLLARALSAAQRGVTVTRQLLSFARQQMIMPKRIDPGAALRTMSAMLSSTLAGGITVETDLAEALWPIEIDPSELELAVLNLGINARDAMPEGGVLRIAASNRTVDDPQLHLNGRFVAIEIRDNGTGISPEVLPRVFDPFFTTKPVGVGSGLGLSQVHGFALQAGGGVALETELGKGTVVRIYLPAVQQAAQAAIEIVAEPLPASAATGGTILIVEDDEAVADIAAGALSGCGFSVRLADRAQLALDLLRQGERVDLVFSDVVMPGMSGIDLAEELHRGFPAIPVLLTTGYSEATEAAAARGLEIIAKPYLDRELCRSINRILGRCEDQDTKVR
jgi:signal transduction histidine kinase/ActR/RegA family two-component response regulator